MLDHLTHFRNIDAFIQQKDQQKSNGSLQVTIGRLHCASIAQAPAAEASDVSSHFVIEQQQIDHGQQQT